MFELTVPGKTFLLGEYYVTQPGEAYVITTLPRFRLLSEAATFALINIHPASPAGKLIYDNLDFFSSYQLTFIDPYNELGGFGASTAQFLLAYQWLQQKKHPDNVTISNLDLINCYLHYAWNGQGIKPSGADLLAQTVSNICYINKTTLEITPLNWPFSALEFHILHTNNKLATHTHLTALEKLNTAALEAIFKNAKNAFEAYDSSSFCEAINQYHYELFENKLVSNHTLRLIEIFNAHNDILAAKGCGAMGADTLLLITKKNHAATIKKLCKQFNLTYIANNHNLEP